MAVTYALDHESGNDSVEDDIVVFVSGSESGKVLASLRNGLAFMRGSVDGRY